MNAAVKLAERATLGALMLTPDPELVNQTVRRLRASDFAEPWHAEVFRSIRDVAVEGKTADPHTVGLALISRLGPNYAEAVRIADCLRIVPPNPDLPGYTAMVIEASARREVAGLGVLLQAGALAAVLEGSPRPLQTLTAVIDATVDAAEARAHGDLERKGIDRMGADPRRLGASPPALNRRAWLDQGLTADRMLGAHPMPPPAQVAAHEADLIAALVGRASALNEVRGWLRPDAITDPGSQQVYCALTRLADHGRPLDLVSVAWEVSRAGDDGPTIPALRSRVESAQPRSPGYLARLVACDHLRLRARTAAHTIASVAEDPSRELWEVIAIARRETSALRDAAPAVDARTPSRAAARLRAPLTRQPAVVPEGRAG